MRFILRRANPLEAPLLLMPMRRVAGKLKIEGIEQEAIRIALGMLEEEFDEKIIFKLTGLNKEKINALLKSKKHAILFANRCLFLVKETYLISAKYSSQMR